jgi:ion channel-forming bestrophin family protein
MSEIGNSEPKGAGAMILLHGGSSDKKNVGAIKRKHGPTFLIMYCLWGIAVPSCQAASPRPWTDSINAEKQHYAFDSSLSSTISTTSKVQQQWSRGTKDTIDAFLGDLSKLQQLMGQCPLLTDTHSKRDSSYTKSWTGADWDHHQVRSFQRYLRHLFFWPTSPTAHAVFPAVLAVMIWSTIVYHIVIHQAPFLLAQLEKAQLSVSLTALSAPLSLLLALRTNRALDRLLEARGTWGMMLRNCNSLASLVSTYLAPLDQEKALLIGRYLSIYGWTVKGYFRNEDDELVLRTILPSIEAKWIEHTPGDRPTAIISRIRQLIGDQSTTLSFTASQAMEARLTELESILGICKRLLGSPIPPTYTRHTSRVLCLYLGLMPLALIGNSKAGLIGILINVALASYVFVGVDEIGVEIENPFPLLPMFHLCKGNQENVANQFIISRRRPQ